jgi:hypothetical protein
MMHVIANDHTKVWTQAELIQPGKERRRLFAPGKQFSYSTTPTGGNAYIGGSGTQAINTTIHSRSRKAS